MYKAVGRDTQIVYGYADTKCDLFRKLDKSFPYSKKETRVYPEPLIIAKETKPHE